MSERSTGEHHESHSDEDDKDAQHLAQLGDLIFLPGLKEWALGIMGFSTAQIFKAWRHFVQQYGGNLSRIGADVRAELGQYVMPSPGCEIEKDSGGFAGCITRIERPDCTVEMLTEGKKVVKFGESEVDGDKKETIFVTWAFDGLEKGGYAIPNRWQIVMKGKNLTDENEQRDKTQYFPLILAAESHIQEAKLKITSRDFNETKEIYEFEKKRSRKNQKNNSAEGQQSPLSGQQSPLSGQMGQIEIQQGPLATKRIKRNRRLEERTQRGGLLGNTLSSILKRNDVSPFDVIPRPGGIIVQDTSSDDSTGPDDDESGNQSSFLSSKQSVTLFTPKSTAAFQVGSPKDRVVSAKQNTIQKMSSRRFDSYLSPVGTRSPSSKTSLDPSRNPKLVEGEYLTRIASDPVRPSQSHGLKRTKEAKVTVFDFVKPRFLESNFLATPIAKPLLRCRSAYKELIPKKAAFEAWDKIGGSKWTINLRMKVLAEIAKDVVHKTEDLKNLKNSQKRSSDYHQFYCYVVKEKEIQHLPQVVAANPGWPRSILMVAPLNKETSHHEVKCLFDELRHLQTSTLCVRDMLQPSDVKDLCESVKTCLPMALQVRSQGEDKFRVLTVLCFVRVNLGAESISFLTQDILMSEYCRIKHLQCKSTNLGDFGAMKIAESLSHIKLRNEPNTDTTKCQVRCGVASTLKSLWLGYNEICDKGAAELGKAVAEHPALEFLDLCGNNITDKGAEAMTVIVQKNATLKQLNLFDNNIFDFGNTAFDVAARKRDAVAENLTVVSGPKVHPKLVCRPKHSKPNSSQSVLSEYRANLFREGGIDYMFPDEVARRIEPSKYTFPVSMTRDRDRENLRSPNMKHTKVSVGNMSIDKQKLLSDRDLAVEIHKDLDAKKTIARESKLKEIIESTLIAHARKSQEGQVAMKMISEHEKKIKKMQRNIENLEKRKEPGYKSMVDSLMREIEWISRDKARREKIKQQAGKQTHKDIMHLLYQQQMILKPEDVILSTHEPSVDFLTDMDAILNGPIQVLDSSPKEDPFPPVDTKEAFIFDPDQVHPGLELDPEGCAHSLQDTHRLQTEDIQHTFVAYVSEVDCDWRSVLLTPTLAVGAHSLVAFNILQPGSEKKCNMLFGISKEPYSVLSSKAPFQQSTGIMLFPRQGHVYMDGEIVHTIAHTTILRKGDIFAMLIDGQQSQITFYHEPFGCFRKEVGRLNLEGIKGWNHSCYAKQRLRWAVTLGVAGQLLGVHSWRKLAALQIRNHDVRPQSTSVCQAEVSAKGLTKHEEPETEHSNRFFKTVKGKVIPHEPVTTHLSADDG